MRLYRVLLSPDFLLLALCIERWQLRAGLHGAALSGAHPLACQLLRLVAHLREKDFGAWPLLTARCDLHLVFSQVRGAPGGGVFPASMKPCAADYGQHGSHVLLPSTSTPRLTGARTLNCIPPCFAARAATCAAAPAGLAALLLPVCDRPAGMGNHRPVRNSADPHVKQ
ncbi:hypothetical protein ABPG75_007654 [Micractinium tetrahymenae]